MLSNFFFKIATYKGIKMSNNLSEFWLHKRYYYCESTYFFKNYKDFQEDFISTDSMLYHVYRSNLKVSNENENAFIPL